MSEIFINGSLGWKSLGTKQAQPKTLHLTPAIDLHHPIWGRPWLDYPALLAIFSQEIQFRMVQGETAESLFDANDQLVFLWGNCRGVKHSSGSSTA